MKRLWTIIGVRDVTHSSAWYQSLLGLPATPPAHEHFGQVCDTDGTVLLCLHRWGEHEHPTLADPDRAEPGHGLLLFFRVDDFDRALDRARTLVAYLEGGAQCESQHGHQGIRIARSRRVLRHGQCLI